MTENLDLDKAETAEILRLSPLDDRDVKKHIIEHSDRVLRHYRNALAAADRGGQLMASSIMDSVQANRSIRDLANAVRTMGNARKDARFIAVAGILDRFGDSTVGLFSKSAMPRDSLLRVIASVEGIKAQLLRLLDGRSPNRKSNLDLGDRILAGA